MNYSFDFGPVDRLIGGDRFSRVRIEVNRLAEMNKLSVYGLRRCWVIVQGCNDWKIRKISRNRSCRVNLRRTQLSNGTWGEYANKNTNELTRRKVGIIRGGCVTYSFSEIERVSNLAAVSAPCLILYLCRCWEGKKTDFHSHLGITAQRSLFYSNESLVKIIFKRITTLFLRRFDRTAAAYSLINTS